MTATEKPRTFEEVMKDVARTYVETDAALRSLADELAVVTPLTAGQALDVIRALRGLPPRVIDPRVIDTASDMVRALQAQVPEHSGGHRHVNVAQHEEEASMPADEAWRQYGKPAYERHLSGRRVSKTSEAVAWLDQQWHPDAPLARRRAMAEIIASGTRISALDDGRFAVYAPGSTEPKVLDREGMERFVSVYQAAFEKDGPLRNLILRSDPQPASLPQSQWQLRDGYGFTPMRPDRDIR